MARHLTVAAAQTGPIDPAETRAGVVRRLTALLREAHARGAELVVFPECALVPFFPHWWVEDDRELDAYFEDEVPNAATRPLFDEAARLGVGFCPISYPHFSAASGSPGADLAVSGSPATVCVRQAPRLPSDPETLPDWPPHAQSPSP